MKPFADDPFAIHVNYPPLKVRDDERAPCTARLCPPCATAAGPCSQVGPQVFSQVRKATGAWGMPPGGGMCMQDLSVPGAATPPCSGLGAEACVASTDPATLRRQCRWVMPTEPRGDLPHGHAPPMEGNAPQFTTVPANALEGDFARATGMAVHPAPGATRLMRRAVEPHVPWKMTASVGGRCPKGTAASSFLSTMALGNTLTREMYCVPTYMGLSGPKTTSCSGNDTQMFSYGAAQIGGHSGESGEALPACIAGAGFHGPLRAQPGGLPRASNDLRIGCTNPVIMNRGIEVSKAPALVKQGRQMYLAPLYA